MLALVLGAGAPGYEPLQTGVGLEYSTSHTESDFIFSPSDKRGLPTSSVHLQELLSLGPLLAGVSFSHAWTPHWSKSATRAIVGARYRFLRYTFHLPTRDPNRVYRHEAGVRFEKLEVLGSYLHFDGHRRAFMVQVTFLVPLYDN